MVKLIVLHFIADFLLQTRDMGRLKSSRWDYLLAHISIIFIAFAIFYGPMFAFWNALFHAIIDRNVWNLYKYSAYFRIRKIVAKKFGSWTQPPEKDPNILAEIANWKFWEDKVFFDTIGFDQMLHGVTLAILAKMYHIV